MRRIDRTLLSLSSLFKRSASLTAFRLRIRLNKRISNDRGASYPEPVGVCNLAVNFPVNVKTRLYKSLKDSDLRAWANLLSQLGSVFRQGMLNGWVAHSAIGLTAPLRRSQRSERSLSYSELSKIPSTFVRIHTQISENPDRSFLLDQPLTGYSLNNHLHKLFTPLGQAHIPFRNLTPTEPNYWIRWVISELCLSINVSTV